MRIYIVTASINPLENLCMLAGHLSAVNEVKVLVIDEGDENVRKTNDKLLSGLSHEYYGPKEREAWFKERFGRSYQKYSRLIPGRCHAEISFGFLKAYEDEADVVLELDDDVELSDGFLEAHINNLFGEEGVTVSSLGKWYNTIENLVLNTNQTIFPRGHPYNSECRNENYAWINEGGKCVLNMGLWSGHPDLDALTILYYGGLDGKCSIESMGHKRDKVILGKGTYFAVCSMNTSFLPVVIPAFYQLYMNFNGIDRFDDIWSGVFLKKIADHVGDKLCLGKPSGKHVKRSRSIFKDLLKEVNGLEMNEYLWRICETAEFSAKSYADCYLELADHLDKNLNTLAKRPEYMKFWKIQIENMQKWVEVTDKVS
ncbi:MAG: alpha-1 4-glucan-protein synthase [Candidatus Bathyarchaeia archaeon]